MTQQSDSTAAPEVHFTDGAASPFRRAARAIVRVLAGAGGQNFLGARWVRLLLTTVPAAWRPALALWLLGLSPHYFQGRDRSGEARRNRRSREIFVRDVLAPYVEPEQDLLDVGCGPGYLARAVSGRVWSVAAIDISKGVLACARVLNPAINIDYRTPREFFASGRKVDIAVCLAVAQHLGDDELSVLLASVHGALRPGGRLLLHVVVDDPHWRTEADINTDDSALSRVRRRYGLHCYGRSRDAAVRLVEQAGFSEVALVAISDLTSLDDDVANQHLLTARRPADTVPVATQRLVVDPSVTERALVEQAVREQSAVDDPIAGL